MTSLALLLAGVVTATPAAADTAPPDPATPVTVSADPLPTVQIDGGVVWTQVVVGRTVYAAGNFTAARPAGSAPGTNTVPRSYLLAYDITTGELNASFAPVLNGQVLTLAASPDGSRLYVGGDFTQVNGKTRSRIAAFDTATGQLVPSFVPLASTQVRTIIADGSTVYLGGNFAAVSGVARKYVAAVDAATGAVLPWDPSADAPVNALTFDHDKTKVVIGGRFQNLGTTPAYGLGAVDLTAGATLPWATTGIVRNAGTSAAITSLASDADGVYGGGYVYGQGGNLEGSFRADNATGEVIWIEDCHGDTVSVYPRNDVVYTVGHPHYCGNIGGFPQTDPWTMYHSTSFSKEVKGTVKPDPYGYYNFAGNPAPALLNWFPTWYGAGQFTSQGQAGWHVTGDGTYVVIGGEFQGVNGVVQQGLVRFAVPSVAPNLVKPNANDGLTPSVTSFKSGTARVAWQATHDRDNEAITYKVFRNFKSLNDTPVHQSTVSSTFWNRPAISFTDTTVTPGQTYTYRVYAFDPFGNSVTRAATSVVVADPSTESAYAAAVTGDNATAYYRLDESAGTVVTDYAGADPAVAGSGVSRGAGGALTNEADAASTFDGTANGVAATQVASSAPTTFSVEAWFSTTSSRGGKIVGFGTSSTGDSSSYDRHVYMDNAGRIIFGVHPGGVRTLTSASGLNDGAWHHVVATLGANGMTLFVDGKQVASRTDVTSGQGLTGFWRIGGDNLTGWPSQPTSKYFAGTIDEVAVYPTALSRAQVDAHYVASGRTSTLPPRPADAYGAAVYDLGPDLYWRLGEGSGTTAADSGTNERAGTYAGGVTLGATGAVATGGTAARFDGSNDGVFSQTSSINPMTYSEEAWFQTTTTRGGKIIGFGANQTGGSSSYDRHVYLQDDGRVVFGVWTGRSVMITTPTAYNDGDWHHVVATQGTGGMALYLDGELVGTDPNTAAENYTGYWRVGGDTTWGSTSAYLDGVIDEVAVYSSVLTHPQVQDHYAKGGGSLPVNQLPTASFTASCTGLDCTVDASASTDPEGPLASYAWDLGDGATATGATATHAYTTGGTRTITLTVTDAQGATASTTREVSPQAPNQAPTAVIAEPACTDLGCTFDGSGSSDADGSVASYAWELGDGGTSTVAKPSHTYAAAGTYTVRLTVTDDDGASGVVSRDVTVSAPPAGVLAQDAFGRSVTGGLGAADVGGAWSVSGGASSFSVADGWGRFLLGSSGASRSAYLAGPSSTDTDAQVDVTLDKAATGGGTYLGVVARGNAVNGYRGKVQVRSNGSLGLSVVRVVSNAETTLASASLPGVTFAAGDVLTLRMQAVGSSPTALKLKVWKAGTAEPAAWQVTTTDSTASLQAAAGVGVWSFVSGSATNTPVTLGIDNLVVRPSAG